MLRRLSPAPPALAVVLLLGAAVFGGAACHRATPGDASVTADAAASDTSARYSTRTPTDGGTGVVYFGREIATPVSVHAARWLERPEREATELPARVIDALAPDSAATACDVGAGTGYFTFRLAERLPRGHVVAQDVEGEMLGLIATRRDALGLGARVDTVRGTSSTPNLAPASCDLVLLVDSYHEFRYPHEMMQGIVGALRPGGRVALVEYRGEDPSLGIRPLHAMTRAQVEREMAAVGLHLTAAPDVLPTQHLLVFTPR